MKPPYIILRIFLLLVFCRSAGHAGAQTTPFILGTVEKIHSAILSEDRVLNVYMPQGYRPDTAGTYPVVYLLDGSADEDFPHVAGLVQFLAMTGIMPPAVVVGVANVDRKRDFTHPSPSAKDRQLVPTSGGSKPFIAFMETEVLPYIQARYRTGQKTLVGQSLGGLLATEMLLERPGLFDRYIIVSPSLWWAEGNLLAGARERLKNYPSKPPVRVCVSVGSEGVRMVTDAKKLVSVLRKAAVPGMRTDFISLPKENHATILHRALYAAFELWGTKQ